MRSHPPTGGIIQPMSLGQLIKRSDPRIVVMAGLTLIAVIFCIFKMVGALTGSESTPEYERTPPTAFSVPLVDTIVDPQALNQPRLPDDAYNTLGMTNAAIGNKIAAQTLSTADLERAGMSPDAALAALAQIKAYYSLYAGRSATIEKGLSLNGVSPSSADVSQNINYGTASNGAPPGAFTVAYSYSYADGVWTLNTLSAQS